MRPVHFKAAAAVLWVLLVGVTVATAPPSAPGTSELIVRMATGQLDGINVSLFALFNLMGLWPIAMAIALRFDRAWWKWLFILASFVVGAFALLPYFVLRPWLLPQVEPRTWVSSVLANRWLSLALGLGAVAFGGMFFLGGLPEFAQLARAQQFPYVMMLDFFAFCGAAVLLGIERREAP